MGAAVVVVVRRVRHQPSDRVVLVEGEGLEQSVDLPSRNSAGQGPQSLSLSVPRPAKLRPEQMERSAIQRHLVLSLLQRAAEVVVVEEQGQQISTVRAEAGQGGRAKSQRAQPQLPEDYQEQLVEIRWVALAHPRAAGKVFRLNSVGHPEGGRQRQELEGTDTDQSGAGLAVVLVAQRLRQTLTQLDVLGALPDRH
jgi:hypothetical protein